MSGAHTDIPPELRRLAQAILNGIDPAVRAAAIRAASGGTGKCQQVWCPVCALAAVISGEQHPMLTVIADHSVALLDVIRAMVDDIERASAPAAEAEPAADGPADDAEAPARSTNGNGTGSAKARYQPITVTLQD